MSNSNDYDVEEIKKRLEAMIEDTTTKSSTSEPYLADLYSLLEQDK